VADNELYDISNLFRFKGLIALTLNNNKLNAINDEEISDGNEIVSLNIDNTTLSNINFVRKLKRIRELSASNNRIRSLDVRKLSGCDDLTYISIQLNPLEIIYGLEDVENFLPALSVLDITDCVVESNCLRLLELYNIANDKSLNLNINITTLSACLRV
jgi:Leucine-rich repeat (LRR) protein